MKLKVFITFLFISFLYSSCSVNNTSEEEVTAPSLIGSWRLIELTMDNAILNVTSPVLITLTGSGFGKNLNATLTFSENPNQVTVNGNLTFQLTYKEPFGQDVTEDIVLDNLLFNDNFGFTTTSWELIDNTLTLNEGGETLNINVISFTDNEIRIETDVNKSISIDNVTSTVLGKAVMVLEK